MLNRKIYKKLEDFFENDKRALLISGARQTGKTYSIREIGSKCFERVIEINFLKQPDAVTIFNTAKIRRTFFSSFSFSQKRNLSRGRR